MLETIRQGIEKKEYLTVPKYMTTNYTSDRTISKIFRETYPG